RRLRVSNLDAVVVSVSTTTSHRPQLSRSHSRGDAGTWRGATRRSSVNIYLRRRFTGTHRDRGGSAIGHLFWAMHVRFSRLGANGEKLRLRNGATPACDRRSRVGEK